MNDLEQLERAFEARAAEATISDDADVKIARRVRRLQAQRRITSSVAVAAVLAIVVAVAAVVHNSSKQHVRVESPDFPELTVTRFELAHVPTGLTLATDASGTCARVHRSDGKVVCDDAKASAATSYATDKDMNDREQVTTSVGGPTPSQFGTTNPRPVTVRGHRGTISEVEASLGHYQLDWDEAPNEHVSMMGRKTDSQAQLLQAAESLVPHAVTVPLAVQTNTYHVDARDAFDIPGASMATGADVAFGVRADAGRLCFGPLDAVADASRAQCSVPDVASAFAVSPDSGTDRNRQDLVDLFGTVKLDAVNVRVTFNDGTTQTSKVGGREIGLGTGFWIVPWNSKKLPVSAVALDAKGAELARLDLHNGMFEPARGFTEVATGVINGKQWRIASGMPGQPCVEVQAFKDRGYFCGNDGGAPLAATRINTEYTNDATLTTVFVRLQGSAVGARLDNGKGHTSAMRVVDVPGIGRVAVGGDEGNEFHVTAVDAAGHDLDRVAPELGEAVVDQSSVLATGTTAKGTWTARLGAVPFVTSPVDDVIAGRRVDGTFCIGVGYGNDVPVGCVANALYDSYLANNGGAAATVGDPPVVLGVVPASVAKVRVELAGGGSAEASTAPLETVAGVRLWVTAIPEGASVTKVDSLDANGTVIGAAQEIVPFSFIAPVG